MYKVKNGTRGTLSLKLEFSSIPLKSGAVYDLDGVCSRKFIRNDPELRKLLLNGDLILLVDSEKNIEQSSIKDIAKADKLFAKPTVEKRPNQKSHFTVRHEKMSAINNIQKEETLYKTRNPKELSFLKSKEPVFLDFTKILEEASKEIPTVSSLDSELFVTDEELKKSKVRKKRSKKTRLENELSNDSKVEKVENTVTNEQLDDICAVEVTND